MPELEAVVHAPDGTIRLSGAIDETELAKVVSVFGTYGQQAPKSPAELVAAFPRIAPGGLAAREGASAIYPACCCGLEGWREWQALLSTGTQPWLGHDPAPWIEVSGDRFIVWSDGGLGGPSREPSIVFSREGLARAIEDVERDLHDFAERLKRWSGTDPATARALSKRFAQGFVGRHRRGAADRVSRHR